jgi:glycopeptide antibiotics resistance protein
MFQSKKQKVVSILLFILYFLLLIWVVLFKFRSPFSQVGYLRNINLIPFGASVIIDRGRGPQIDLEEIIMNILVFVPLGVYAKIFLPKKPFFLLAGLCFLVSLCFEVLQYILAIGASDITDLINNTLGGILGIGLFMLLNKHLKEKAVKVVNIIGIVVISVGMSLFGILLMANQKKKKKIASLVHHLKTSGAISSYASSP